MTSRWPVSVFALLVLIVPLPVSGKNITGVYSNYTFTEEHQYGAEMQLWKEGSSYFGVFSFASGQVGDTPIGVLHDLSYDIETNSLSFSAKLTTGTHSCWLHENVPSQDFFRFNGKITENILLGVLSQSDNLHPEISPSVVRLELARELHSERKEYRSRSMWEADMKAILKYRGAKW